MKDINMENQIKSIDITNENEHLIKNDVSRFHDINNKMYLNLAYPEAKTAEHTNTKLFIDEDGSRYVASFYIVK